MANKQVWAKKNEYVFKINNEKNKNLQIDAEINFTLQRWYKPMLSLSSEFTTVFPDGLSGVYFALRLFKWKEDEDCAGWKSILCSRIFLDEDTSFWSKLSVFLSNEERSDSSMYKAVSETLAGITGLYEVGHHCNTNIFFCQTKWSCTFVHKIISNVLHICILIIQCKEDQRNPVQKLQIIYVIIWFPT